MKQEKPRKYYFLRMFLASVLAPSITIPLLTLLYVLIFKYANYISLIVLGYLPFVFLFTCLGGGIAHVVLVTLNRTQLGYYIAAYLLFALPVLIFMMRGSMGWENLAILSQFVAAGIAVPITAWWLFYEGLTRIKL